MRSRRRILPLSLVLSGMFVLAWASVEAGNPFAGEKIYAHYCQNCHGAKGRGLMAGTPDFSWRGSANNNLGLSDRDLAGRILGGKGACPGFQGILSVDDAMNVVTHLRTLR
ncbi:MAG: cytochrome c [Magnetococcales bacterium]|nr:cytochrome c [Magnetococcales bacterium]